MNKKNFRVYAQTGLLLLIGMVLSACGSYKNVAYLSNSDEVQLVEPAAQYDARIMPKDILTITVNATDPKAVIPYNMMVQTEAATEERISATSQPSLKSYLVENDGTIVFPVVGKIKVGGLTKSEAEQMILDHIKPYFVATETPIVTVNMASYSISVLGEVQTPGSFIVSSEKINVLQALAKAGDMTIYGVRNNVKLIREDQKGKKQIITLNLNDANLLNSPYYYLQQNDILYVEPNKAKAQNSAIGNMTSLWFSGTSILVSLATLIVSIINK